MNKNDEIKRILLGRVLRNEKGVLVVRPKGVYTQVNGLVDGYFSVLFFGVMSRTRSYHWESAKKSEEENLRRYVQQLGEELYLEDHPKALACFTGKMALTPTVVTVEIKKEQFDVTVYTGRTPFGVLRCMAMQKRMKHLLGDFASEIKPKKEKGKAKK